MSYGEVALISAIVAVIFFSFGYLSRSNQVANDLKKLAEYKLTYIRRQFWTRKDGYVDEVTIDGGKHWYDVIEDNEKGTQRLIPKAVQNTFRMIGAFLGGISAEDLPHSLIGFPTNKDKPSDPVVDEDQLNQGAFARKLFASGKACHSGQEGV